MIALLGIPSEPPVAFLRAELEARGVPFLMVNQRAHAEASYAAGAYTDLTSGRLAAGALAYPVDQITAVYLRLMDWRQLPALETVADGSAAWQACRQLHEALAQWTDEAHATVVNRPSAQASNASKPFQAQLISAHGFNVPATLITNDPERVRAFARDHSRVIYKSISAARSIVRLLTEEDLSRLDLIRRCPVQFQAFIPGMNVRVHVVGDRVFATAVATEAIDYRYVRRDGAEDPLLEGVELPGDIEERCVSLTRGLGLEFSGIDLKLTREGEVYCFEVNPSPAYTYYQAHTGQPIAAALADHLLSGRTER